MKYMGLDVGTKRIGVALSDPQGIIAQGLTTIERKSLVQDLENLNFLIKKFSVRKIVVGLPRRTDGRLSEMGIDALNFAEKLKGITGLPVVTMDEFYTTKEAERVLIQGGVRRKERRQVIDKLSAVLILQRYLDGISQEKGSAE